MKSKDNIRLTISIVLYNEEPSLFHKTIKAVMNYPNLQKLFIVDNGPIKNLEFEENDKIEYIHSDKNVGFGAGHNLVMSRISMESNYHLILNPDVDFDAGIFNELIEQLEKDKDLAFIAPKVLFPNGDFQNSCRRYPKFSELFFRRFPLFSFFAKRIINHGVYTDKNLEEPFYVDYLTGCFHLYKTEDFIKIGGFDERYFLYMEDVDICKKVDEIGKKKMYYPKVHIYHVLKRGSSKNFKLFMRHTISMIKYFTKWGFSLKARN